MASLYLSESQRDSAIAIEGCSIWFFGVFFEAFDLTSLKDYSLEFKNNKKKTKQTQGKKQNIR